MSEVVSRYFEVVVEGSDWAELLCSDLLEPTADEFAGETFSTSMAARVKHSSHVIFFDNSMVTLEFVAQKDVYDKDEQRNRVLYKACVTNTRLRQEGEWWPNMFEEGLVASEDNETYDGYVTYVDGDAEYDDDGEYVGDGEYDDSDDEDEVEINNHYDIYENQHGDGPLTMHEGAVIEIGEADTNYDMQDSDEIFDRCEVQEVWDYYLDDIDKKPHRDMRYEYYFDQEIIVALSVARGYRRAMVLGDTIEEDDDMNIKDAGFVANFSEFDLQLIEAICKFDFAQVKQMIDKKVIITVYDEDDECGDEYPGNEMFDGSNDE